MSEEEWISDIRSEAWTVYQIPPVVPPHATPLAVRVVDVDIGIFEVNRVLPWLQDEGGE